MTIKNNKDNKDKKITRTGTTIQGQMLIQREALVGSCRDRQEAKFR